LEPALVEARRNIEAAQLADRIDLRAERFEHLEEELDRNGFLRNAAKRPSMVRNLRNLLQRAQCTEQEVRTLHGVITAFAGPRGRK